MEQSLKEQLAAAHAEFQQRAAEQQKLSEASGKIQDEIRGLTRIKEAAASAQEEAAQVSARCLIGEATDDEVARAREASDRAAFDAAGADRRIADRQRQAELIHGRYMDTVPPCVAAQNVCNQFRGAVLAKSAEASAVRYLEAAAALKDALTDLFGHAKAMSRIQGVEPFVRYFNAEAELPAFPTLKAFQPNPHSRRTLVAGDVDKAADAIVNELRADGYAF